MRLLLVPLLVALATAGCASGETRTAGGFASGVGVLGCAETVVWGTVRAAHASDEGLRVTVDVDDWVIPAQGDAQTTFVADDPAGEVGAPSWQDVGPVLVIISPVAPPSHQSGTDAERMVQDWVEAGAPRLTGPECARA